MKPHPIGLYLLCVILAKFCKAQNGYHYNRPTGRPFLPAANNQIPNSNQKLSGTYQPHGSQKSYQNELSPSGYQYNRPSSKYPTTPSPQSQTVGFPQPFRPNSGTASQFLGNTNPTTSRGIVNTEFSGTTSNPSVSGETPEDRTAGVTSSPFNSRGSLGAGTSSITSSPLNAYPSSQPSSNGNYNYRLPATSFTPNRDYGNYQPVSDTNTTPGSGFDNGSNNQFRISPSIQQTSGSDVENSGNAATRNQLGSPGYDNFDSGSAGDFGTNTGYGGNAASSTPVSENVNPVGSFQQRPGTANTVSYNQNSAAGLGPSNTYHKNSESIDTTGSNAGNAISNSNDQYIENLIPQGTSNFGPGAEDGYGSNAYLETQRPNSFNIGSTGAYGSNNVYGGNSAPQRPSNLNNGDSNIKGSSTGYSGNSGLTGASSGDLSNIGSNNALDGLPDNQNSGNFNVVNLGNSDPSSGYSNFGPQQANNGLLGNSPTSRPNTLSTGNGGDNTFSSNLGQQEPNNAIEGSFGSQSPTYIPGGDQGSQSPINVLESGTGFPGSSSSFGGNAGPQGFGGANAGNPGPNFNATARPQRPEDNGSGQNGDYSAIPGTPNLDYPVLSEIPPTKFSCDSQKYPGYYADVEARCQVFHICANGLKYDFLCPNGTVFHQRYFVCVWWNQFECNSAESLYSLNENLYDYDKIGSLIANAAGATGAQGPSVTNILGFSPQGSSSNLSPSTGSPINLTPSSSFEGLSNNYGSPSQTQGPSSDFGALAGPQSSSTSSSFIEPTSNYDSPNQQQGSIPNIGSSIAPYDTSSSLESLAGLQSSSGGFTPPSSYEKPSTNYDFSSPLQSHSSNFESSVTPPGQSVNYGALNNRQGPSNNYEQFSSPGGESASGSPSNFQGYSTFGSSPDLQGSSASYPGYQGLGPSAGAASVLIPQSPSAAYSSYSTPQNSAANFGSFVQPQGVTNTGRPPLSSQELANYESSHGSQSFSPNFENSASPQSSSGYSRPSTGLQEPGAYFGSNYNPQSSYDSSGSLPESSTNLGQIGGRQGFTSTNSPLTTPQESTTEYSASPTQQSFSGNVIPLTGITSSTDNYPQSSGFQEPSSNYGLSANLQRPSSIYKPILDPYSGHYSSSGPKVQPLNGSSYNSPGKSPSFVVPAGASSSSSYYSPSSSPQGNFAGSGQQNSLQKPSPSYGPPSSSPSKFGPQQSLIFNSTPNPQRSSSSYSPTSSLPGPSSFRQPSASQITSASFSPLSNRPSSNYNVPANPSGSTFASNFGGSQGSSPAPFTLAETSQRPFTVYGPPSSIPLNTPRPQLNYSPSRVNQQQSDFGNSAPNYYGSSNKEQSLNYPTTIGPNRPLDVGITEQPSTFSNSGYPSTATTLTDSFSSPFSSASTIQSQAYSTESNIPSNSFSGQESSFPNYDRETTLRSNAAVLSSNQQVIKPNREYLPPFRKRR